MWANNDPAAKGHSFSIKNCVGPRTDWSKRVLAVSIMPPASRWLGVSMRMAGQTDGRTDARPTFSFTSLDAEKRKNSKLFKDACILKAEVPHHATALSVLLRMRRRKQRFLREASSIQFTVDACRQIRTKANLSFHFASVIHRQAVVLYFNRRLSDSLLANTVTRKSVSGLSGLSWNLGSRLTMDQRKVVRNILEGPC